METAPVWHHVLIYMIVTAIYVIAYNNKSTHTQNDHSLRHIVTTVAQAFILLATQFVAHSSGFIDSADDNYLRVAFDVLFTLSLVFFLDSADYKQEDGPHPPLT
jgi:protein-S-isoprenylcysteine O-methyltransferase Ste14